MESFLDFLLMLGLTLGVGAASLVGAAQDRRRRELIEEFAQTQGFEFSPKLKSSALVGLHDLPAFERRRLVQALGKRRYVRNVLHQPRADGDSWVVDADYEGTSGDGEGVGSTSCRLTLAYVVSPRLDLPRLWLRPRVVRQTFGGLLSKGVPLECYGEFGELYSLEARDPNRARDAFQDPKLRQLLTASASHRAGWGLIPVTLCGDGTRLIVYREFEECEAEDFPQFLEQVQSISDQLASG